MIAALDGVDMIVFTGGIGENDRGSARRDLRRPVLDRRQPRRSSEPVREQSRSAIRVALFGARSPLAGRRADRPPYACAVHKALPDSTVSVSYFASRLRIASNSRRRAGARFRISHFESFERIEDDLGHDQPGVLLVVGGNDIPGRVIGCLSRPGIPHTPSCTASRISAPRCPPG